MALNFPNAPIEGETYTGEGKTFQFITDRWVVLAPEPLQGDKGDTGDTGATGPQGDQGIQGIQGETGAAGADGEAVLNGTVDPTTEGVDGDFYINTTTDEIFGPKTGGVWGTGTSLVGPQGIQGDQGIQGVKGDTGDQGIQGIQGVKGDQGDQGIQGVIGPDGPQGDQGIQGIQGVQGDQGIQGITGDTGAAGADGLGVPAGGATGEVLTKVSATDNDTEWAAGGGGGSGTTTGPTFPVSPASGDMHYITVDPTGLFTYYEDVDSSQWVQVNGSTAVGDSSVTIVENNPASSGHLIMGDVLIQWGQSSGDNATINFPIVYKTIPRVIASSGHNTTTTSQVRTASAASITITGFKLNTRYIQGISAPTSSGGVTQWISIGEVADADKLPKTINVIGDVIQEFHDPAGLKSWKIVGNTLECWGKYVGGANGIAHTFPKTFANGEVIVTGSCWTSDGTTVMAASMSTTGFTSYVKNYQNTASTVNIYWRAIGQWDGIS